MNRKFVLLTVLFLFLSNPMFLSAASWELYDDFNSGTLDPEKWNSSSPVSTITVENKRVKFTHFEGHPNQSGYLRLDQDPENILGIKAAITISSCTGDVRTRIAGYVGRIGENHIWSGLQLQPGSERIYSSSGLEGPEPDYLWIKDLHYGEYQIPLNLTGNTYNASMIFSSEKIIYEVEGLGKITYKYAAGVDSATDIFKAIGTRSTNGDGPCTVYVDNVYVLRP